MWKIDETLSQAPRDQDKIVDWKPLKWFQNTYVSSILELTELVSQAQQTILRNIERRKNNS